MNDPRHPAHPRHYAPLFHTDPPEAFGIQEGHRLWRLAAGMLCTSPMAGFMEVALSDAEGADLIELLCAAREKFAFLSVEWQVAHSVLLAAHREGALS